MTSKGNFTALILITGVSNPNIEAEILSTLSPFAIQILDKQSMSIRDRYFLAILFALDQAHAKAIEADLTETCSKLEVDLAVDYQFISSNH